LGASAITTSDTAPASPQAGDLWYQSSTGKQFIRYDSFWVEMGNNTNASVSTHASNHIRGGSDIIDGDRVTIDYVPTNYTRNSAATGAGDVTDLTAHLAGIDMILPAGMLMPYAGSTEPTGWVFCYGQTVNSVSNTAYARLWTAIGTTYGGASASSFILPDLRGRAVFGKDNMGGTAASRVTSGVSVITGTTLGAVGGSEALHTHTHTQNSHTHGPGSETHFVTNQGALSGTTAGASEWQGYNRATTTAATTATNQNTGTGSSQNMPPTIITNYLIKL
jgi:microcystin-dependent protein